MTASTSTTRSSPYRPIIFIGIIIVAIGAVVAASNWWMPAERVAWRDDLPAAQIESRTTNKPILLYFTASWCGPCQYMRRHVWTNAAVGAAAQKFLPVRIDIDKQPALARQYHVQAIPRLSIMDGDGNIQRSVNRAMEAGELVNWLNGKRDGLPIDIPNTD